MSALPWWVAVTLAASMLGVAMCCACRLATSGRRLGGRGNDSCHLLMGIAMAGMAVAGLATLPVIWWLVIFAGYSLWFAGRLALTLAVRRQPSRQALVGTLPYLLMSGSMVYMLAAMPTMAAMPGMAGMAGASTVPVSDLLCGAWMLGMHGTTAAPAIPLPALGLAVLCFADAALATRHVLRRTGAAGMVTEGLETKSLENGGATTSEAVPALAGSVDVVAPAELAADGTVALLTPVKVANTWSVDLAAACHVAMPLAMGIMLVAMR